METVYKAVAQAAADNVAQYGINHNDYTFGNVRGLSRVYIFRSLRGDEGDPGFIQSAMALRWH